MSPWRLMSCGRSFALGYQRRQLWRPRRQPLRHHTCNEGPRAHPDAGPAVVSDHGQGRRGDGAGAGGRVLDGEHAATKSTAPSRTARRRTRRAGLPGLVRARTAAPPRSTSMDSTWTGTRSRTRLFERFVKATGHKTTAEREGDGFVWQQKDGKWQSVKVDGASWGRRQGPAAHRKRPTRWCRCRGTTPRRTAAGRASGCRRRRSGRRRRGGRTGGRYPWGDEWDPREGQREPDGEDDEPGGQPTPPGRARSASTTWRATSGNGSPTGLRRTTTSSLRNGTRVALRPGRAGSCAAGPGATIRSSCERRTATTSRPTSGAAIWGFGARGGSLPEQLSSDFWILNSEDGRRE